MNSAADLHEANSAICSYLSERSAVLFLGAGINAGTVSSAGNDFPLGNELSRWICRDILDDPDLNVPLEDSAEMAQQKVGPKGLNDYLFKEFSKFTPGTAHLALVQLPWDIIYTTNYDLLIEMAGSSSAITPAGPIKPVFSTDTDLGQFHENDVLYYKLHGSVDVANTPIGRLILTRDDYRFYEQHRKLLFRRLRTDLALKTFVFIGYSLRDDNFRAILSDIRAELATEALPLSYAVIRDFKPAEATFWRDKYNIQLLAFDATEFSLQLRDSWVADSCSVVPFEQRKSTQYIGIDQSTQFPKVGESFYRVLPAKISGQSDPSLFFRGSELTWADARDQIVPPRDDYWTLLDSLFPDLIEPKSSPTTYLVTGHAGTGKSALLRTMAYEVASDFENPVLVHIPGTPLDVRVLRPLVDETDPRRIIVIVHHAADYVKELERFIDDLRRLQLPVSVLLEERRNQWNVAASTIAKRLSPAEIDLGALSDLEIDNILAALAQGDCLGKLKGTDLSYQKQHFQTLAHKELLVALRELTSSNDSFDQIVLDEYRRIPSPIAKTAYVYVAALGQINLSLRYEHLMRILHIGYGELRSTIFQPADGVLISGEVTGSSRHNSGFTLGTRHPIIASIIFDAAAPSDDEKFEIINRILTEMDPGYLEDRRLLDEIVRRKEIVNTLADPNKRRAIYDRLASVLPNNPYVLQHRSILERDIGDADATLRFARIAVNMEKGNPSLQNTLGLGLEFAARHTRDVLKQRGYLTEASKIFADGVRKDPTNPFAYVGQSNILKQEIERATDGTQRTLLRANAIAMLEEALENTYNSTIVAASLAEHQNAIGDMEEATKVVAAALKTKPSDSRLRGLQIDLLTKSGKHDDGLKAAQEGIKYDPTSWRLQRYAARLMKRLGLPVEGVRGHYEAALRHNKGDIALTIELGAFLFTNALYPDANAIFNIAQNLPVPVNEKRKVRENWRDSHGMPLTFSGRVSRVTGSAAFVIAIPQNFSAFFWRNRAGLADLQEGDPVTFQVAFNDRGSVALDITSRKGQLGFFST